MKLFTKYSRINVLSTIAIFLIASGAFYFTIKYVLIQQIDDDLKIEKKEIVSYAQKHDHLPESISVKDQLINYTPVNEPFTKNYFTTSNITDTEDKDKEKFRQFIFGIHANGTWYKITVSKSLEDTDDLINSILLITVSTILVILIVSFIINRVVLKRIWKPYYHSLNIVKEFKISGNEGLKFVPSKIDEFEFMNQTLERITNQAQVDYLSLKTFSENASHEIQTPIAIIRSKLDLLIQDENLTQQQGQTLQSAYNAIQKLTRLNQSLLLLAKIENKQYEEIQSIDLKNELEKKLTDFNELWQSQQIKVDSSLQKSIVNMNTELVDVLLNNLLSNATRHNFTGGTVFIELNEYHLCVSNTSNQPALDNKKIFHRFYKPSQSNEHNGLGLSIIKQICDVSGFSIAYQFTNNMHSFSVQFNSAKNTA